MTIINILCVYQGIFLSLILFNRRENRFSNNILSVIMISLSLPSIAIHFVNIGSVPSAYLLSFLIFPMLFLFNPLIFLYTLSMIGKINRIKRSHLFHFVPAAVSLFIYLIINIYYKLYKVFHLVNKNLLQDFPLLYIIVSAYSMLISVFALVYIIYSLRTLNSFTKEIKEYFSNIAELRILWLKIFMGLIFFIFLNSNISTWMNILNMNNSILSQSSRILNFFFMFITAFFLLRKPDIFKYTHEMLEEFARSDRNISETDSIQPKKKYEKNKIDDGRKGKYLSQLLEYMKNEKPYLEENITLKDLSEKLSISSHHLSIIINEQLNQNFYNFINSYRINDVIEKLSDPANLNKNVLDLAYDSGFNTKSTFNIAFKSITGMTPTEYRKSRISA